VVAAAEVAVEMQHHSHGLESLSVCEFIVAVLRVKVLKMDGFLFLTFSFNGAANRA
jgi:hypothetical protein